jgi:hypothetical protein
VEDRKMTNQEIIASFANNFECTEDGFETANDVASGFFNEVSFIDDNGDIWLGNRNKWATEDQLERFVAWLKENGHC